MLRVARRTAQYPDPKVQPQTSPRRPPVGGISPLRRVLVVDDSRLQLRILSTMLYRWGFEVLEANSVPEALEICAATPPDLVLSDWMMPQVDGLEFCRRFRDLPRDRYGYFILLTSKSDKAAVAQGLDAGEDDFLTKPVNGDELLARINAGARMLGMERELAEKNRIVSETLDELRRAHEAIERDLRQARVIQQALVPDRVRDFGTARVSLLLQPCGHVGGDLVGMFGADGPGGQGIGLYCIDVSGHGITSAMVTARVAGHLSDRFPEQNLGLVGAGRGHALRPPDETAKMLNLRLAGDPGVEDYLTMAYVAGDLATGNMSVVQAGHPPPMVLRADGRTELLGQGGLPIGLFSDASYSAVPFRLDPGDRLLLYSDGFTEAVMREGAMLGETGLADLFRAAAAQAAGPELLDDLFWRLTAGMAPGEALRDDASAALLEYRG